MSRNIYEIRDYVLKKSSRRVFSYGELSNLLNINVNNLRVMVHRMKEKKLVQVLYDKIIFTDDEYIIATQLVEPSYISSKSALYLHRIIQQTPYIIEMVNPKNTIKLDKYYYHKINPLLFFGYNKKRTGDSYMYLGTPEKSVIDGLYLKELSENFVKGIIPELNKRKLLSMAKKVYATKVRGTSKIFSIIKELIK